MPKQPLSVPAKIGRSAKGIAGGGTGSGLATGVTEGIGVGTVFG